MDAASRVRSLPPAHRARLLAELADALVLGRLGGALQDLGRRRRSPAGTWPVGVTSPSRYIQRSRSSAGETPSASAARATWSSAANSTCGAPKPRKAPLGGVFVAMARPRMRVFGQWYGPPAWRMPRDSTTGVSVQ